MKSVGETCSHRWGHWFESSTAHHYSPRESGLFVGAAADLRAALWFRSTRDSPRSPDVPPPFQPLVETFDVPSARMGATLASRRGTTEAEMNVYADALASDAADLADYILRKHVFAGGA